MPLLNKNLDGWTISASDFPHAGTLEQKIRFCLRYAILATSTYNNQPWSFLIEHDTVSVYCDRRFGLPTVDPDDRELVMSCAGALFNLRLALRYFGMRENTQLLPNPTDEDLLARVQVSPSGQAPSEMDTKLFQGIAKPNINRSAYASQVVDSEKLDALREAARKEGAWLHICEGYERKSVAGLIIEGDAIQMSKKSFRRELASWVNERRFLSGDGFPDYARSFGDMMSTTQPHILRRFEIEPGKVAENDEILKGCPVLAILGNDKGGPVGRLYAGQAFMRIILQAEALGLNVSTLNQPCQVPELRLRLFDEIEYSGRAQYILRIGYGSKPVNYSPRRPLDAVIEDSDSIRAIKGDIENTSKNEKNIWGKMKRFLLAKSPFSR